MYKGTGLAVCAGVVVAKAFVYKPQAATLPPSCGNATEELGRFAQARSQAREDLQKLFSHAQSTLGQASAMILDVQLMMLEDVDFLAAVEQAIAQGAGAASAVQQCGNVFANGFLSMEDDYMRARAADVHDVTARLVGVLCGVAEGAVLSGPCILVAEDLTPSETVRFPREMLLGIVTRQGSPVSHTAILARTMGIPALVQADIVLDAVQNGELLAVDGDAGVYCVSPDKATLAAFEEGRAAARRSAEDMEAYRGKKSVTQNGSEIHIYANIGGLEDAVQAVACDAEGVGLLRSEFLYLGRDTLPTEAQLFHAYKGIVEVLAGRPLVIRTLDAGADKQVAGLGQEIEENPALGMRGIRVSLARPEVFLTQLRAIYRAAAFGPVSLMFPMVSALWELKQAKQHCETAQSQLHAQDISTGKVSIGVMIETPAAALDSAALAREVEFFSVGTNDLTQYTLAVDRQNASLARHNDPQHPSVLALLRLTAHSARAAGIWAGVCGELAGEAHMTDLLLEMGYTELSVAPHRILSLRKQVCESEVAHETV